MKGAVEQVIQCRIVLKYSYVLGYYLCSDISNYDPTTSTIPLEKLESAKYLFEHQQELLEKNNELLSELTEDYCNNIYSAITVVASNASKTVATSSSTTSASTASNAVKSNTAATVTTTTSSAGINKGNTTVTPDKKLANDDLSSTPQTISEKRNRIINLTRITEKFMSHLLLSIGTDGNASKILEFGDVNGTGGNKSRMKVDDDGMILDGVDEVEEEEDEEYGEEDNALQRVIMESTTSAAAHGSSNASSGKVTSVIGNSTSTASSANTNGGGGGGIISALWNTLTTPSTTNVATRSNSRTSSNNNNNSIRTKRTSSGNNK